MVESRVSANTHREGITVPGATSSASSVVSIGDLSAAANSIISLGYFFLSLSLSLSLSLYKKRISFSPLMVVLPLVEYVDVEKDG